MARWRAVHGVLARDRYPHLVSFAVLLTGDEDSARTLVDAALVAELSRGRRVGTAIEVEEAVRTRIAREFVKHREHSVPAVATGVAPAATVTVDTAPDPAAEPPPSVFAPPGHEPFGHGTGEPSSAVPHAPEAPGPAPAAAPREEHAPLDVEQALATMPPLDRAIVVLHHAERLTPQRIAHTLGSDAAAVRDRLVSADQALGDLTGLAVRPETYAESADHVEVSVEVTPVGRA